MNNLNALASDVAINKPFSEQNSSLFKAKNVPFLSQGQFRKKLALSLIFEHLEYFFLTNSASEYVQSHKKEFSCLLV